MQQSAQQIHKRRLVQLTAVAEIPLLFIGFKTLWEGETLNSIILLSVAALLSSVFILVRLDKQMWASIAFLIILTSLIFLLQWIGGGVKDDSSIALPTLLIFAAMIGALPFFNALLALILVNTILLGVADSLGYNFVTPGTSTSDAINIAVVLLIVGIATRLLTRDNLHLLQELGRRISEVEEAKSHVEHQANHDHLTGLPNRLQAETKFREIRARLDRDPQMTAGVIYIDFDEFKEINDSLGHDIGDQFLIAKSKRLKDNLRTYDAVCRIGGDEFLVLTENIDENQLAELATKLLNVITIEESIGENRLACTCSVGIVCLPKDADSYEQAVQRADIAMYRSKHLGKNQFHFYNENMETSVQRRFEIQNRMVSAILTKEFNVAYQPIYAIGSQQIIGAEALARWHHPILGDVSPGEFVPIAEASGSIDELCAFVLNQTCELLEELLKLQPDFYISINISPYQLQSAHFFKKCEAVFDQFDLPMSALKFEITETQIISRDPVFEENIAAIHEAGIGLLLDDFGTGYSNLSHLQKMQFETIKIDRSFIFDCYKDKNSVTLLKSIAAMAEQLDVDIVAEGIENESEYQEVLRLGIQKGQGFYWSRGLNHRQFIPFFEKSLSEQV